MRQEAVREHNRVLMQRRSEISRSGVDALDDPKGYERYQRAHRELLANSFIDSALATKKMVDSGELQARGDFNPKNYRFLFGEDASKPGGVSSAMVARINGDTMYIDTLASLIPGEGRQLARMMLKMAKEEGVTKIVGEPVTSAIPVYERMGAAQERASDSHFSTTVENAEKFISKRSPLLTDERGAVGKDISSTVKVPDWLRKLVSDERGSVGIKLNKNADLTEISSAVEKAWTTAREKARVLDIDTNKYSDIIDLQFEIERRTAAQTKRTGVNPLTKEGTPKGPGGLEDIKRLPVSPHKLPADHHIKVGSAIDKLIKRYGSDWLGKLNELSNKGMIQDLLDGRLDEALGLVDTKPKE